MPRPRGREGGEMKPGSRRALRVGALVVVLVATVLTPFQPGRAAPRAAGLPWALSLPSQPSFPTGAYAAPLAAPAGAVVSPWRLPSQTGSLPQAGAAAQPSLALSAARAPMPLSARPAALASTGRLRAAPQARAAAYSRTAAARCSMAIGVFVDGGTTQLSIRAGNPRGLINDLTIRGGGSIGQIMASPIPSSLVCLLATATLPLKATFSAQVASSTNANVHRLDTLNVTITDGGPGNRSISLVDSATSYTLNYTNAQGAPSSWVISAAAPGTVAGSQGIVPWHPHHTVRMASGLLGTVDLADGHLDLNGAGMAIPARGMPLRLTHTYDSIAAQLGTISSLGLGWRTNLHQAVSGAPGSTVTYYDESGVAWPFTYSGGTYTSPPGLPWQLTTTASPVSYALKDILTGETLAFDAGGNFLSDTDSYGNYQQLSYDADGNPTGVTSSIGRGIALTVRNDLQTEATSPLWQSSGGTQGQHLSYAYAGFALQGITAGAGTVDAQTTTFGYTGTLLTSVTTPATHTWTLVYDSTKRVSTIASPSSGMVGQVGYTPAYTTTFTYNAGQTVVTEGQGDPGQLTTTYTLDGQGQATVVADGLSHTRQFSYDADHDVTTSTDGNGNVTTDHYQYIGSGNSVGQLTEVDHPAITPLYPGNAAVAPTFSYAYDPSSHDLTETSDNNGSVTWYTYNGHHDIATVAQLVSTSAGGGTVAFHWRGQIRTYDDVGEMISGIDGRGVTVPDTTSTNAAPGVAANGSAASYTHSWGYNFNGDRTTSSTPPIATSQGGGTTTGPAITQYSYDGDGDLIYQQDPNNYNASDPTAEATKYGYERLGRLNSTTLPSLPLVGTATQALPLYDNKFDGDGNVVQRMDANGSSTYSSYDPLGRQVTNDRPLSLVGATPAITATTILSYNATELTSARDPQGNTTQYQYDAAGRLTRRADAAGEVQQYGYDNQDNATGITLGDGTTATSIVARTFNAANQLATQILSGQNLATPLTTTYSYDLRGNLVRQQQPAGNVTFWGYDLADQLVADELDPNSPNLPSHAHQETFGYDAAGLRVAATDFGGKLTQASYDGDGRQIGQVDGSGGPAPITSAASFDPSGNLAGQTEQQGAATRGFSGSYNPADWPKSGTNDGLTTTATGSGGGDVLGQTILNGAGSIDYNPDAAGRVNMITVTAGGGTPQSSIMSFDNNSLTTGIALPNAVQQAIQYDGASRLIGITARNTANPALLNSAYTYGHGPVGWTTSVATSLGGAAAGTETLTHDALGRLIGSSGGANPGSWSYDGEGNLTSATSNGVTTGYSYDPNNPHELASTSTTGQPTVIYGYDGQGNATSISNGGNSARQLAYDAANRMTSVTLGSSGAVAATVTMTYNAFGQRAGYSVTPQGGGPPSLAESFQYRGDQLAQVAYSGTSVPAPYTDTYIYRQDGSPLELLRQVGAAATPYWYVLDGQGNVVALTDGGGNVVDQYRYDQWGRPTTIQESVPQQLRYAGYWYDGELGWYWLSVRSYDPALGRFLQPDPSEQEGLFSYAYANDNPVDQADPSGLAAAPPPQFGCIVTGDGHFDCDEAVGTPPWNSDLGEAGNIGVVKTQGGIQVIFPVQGCGGFGFWLIRDATSALCKLGKALVRIAQNLVGVSCTLNSNNLQLLNPLGGLENWIGAHLVCPDLKKLVGLQQGNKALAALMLALSVVPAGRVGSVLERFGIRLPELAAKYGRPFLNLLRGARCGCFPAGTAVATPHGSTPIEQLKVGDQVLAEDPSTGKVEPERVQAVIDDGVKPTMRVGLSDGSEQQVTTNHPFYVDSGPGIAAPQWVQAGDLKVGDRIRTANRRGVAVATLRYNTGKAHVYTLTVANDHDFFVGPERVLVHNASGCGYFFDLAQAEIKYGTHNGEFPGLSAHQYVQRAETLANAVVTHGGPILEHMGDDLTVVRFDTRSGEFLVADSVSGEIITFFKPNEGLRYYLNDIRGR